MLIQKWIIVISILVGGNCCSDNIPDRDHQWNVEKKQNQILKKNRLQIYPVLTKKRWFFFKDLHSLAEPRCESLCCLLLLLTVHTACTKTTCRTVSFVYLMLTTFFYWILKASKSFNFSGLFFFLSIIQGVSYMSVFFRSMNKKKIKHKTVWPQQCLWLTLCLPLM